MLLQRWKPIFFGAAFQYVHGIFTQLASRMHVPQEVPLPDLGFSIFPVRSIYFLMCGQAMALHGWALAKAPKADIDIMSHQIERSTQLTLLLAVTAAG